MTSTTKIAIFASGSGSNAINIYNYLISKGSNIKIDCIITNNAKADIINKAKSLNIETILFDNLTFLNPSKLIDFLLDRGIQFIVLAGFLRHIHEDLINIFPQRIINIHPSLLPKYGGKGMYGIKVHEAVIKDKEEFSGITIHLVNKEYDKGQILYQEKVKVSKEDTALSLAKKILEVEHKNFPLVIEQYIQSYKEI